MDRIAVLSDIHSNRLALEAVLADVARRGADLLLDLGDTVWGSVDPAGTVDLLRQAGARGVNGNQDRLLWEDAAGEAGWIRERLGADRLAWLQARPATLALGDLFLCHGTSARDDEYLLEAVGTHGVALRPAEAIGERLSGVAQPVILCGHSHIPRAVWLPSGQLVVNPGSVGMPAYDDDLPYPHVMETGSPHARYALLTRSGSSWQVEHVAVTYPWQEAAAAARMRGREDRARWLETGWA